MCGIAGLVAPALEPQERLAHVQGMIARLKHRGPSGEAFWDGDGCVLGLARLAIVAPHQPARALASESGGVMGVVNGELYNHRELLAELRAAGHEIPDGPDTAVMPHLYEQRGPDFAEAVDGMFAVALWDRVAETLVLARDRAGEKPLFFVNAPGRFAFASEPGALVALPWVARDPAPAAIARYLVHGFFAGGESAYASVRQLPPAHTLVVRHGAERSRRYWRPWDALANGADSTPEAEVPARIEHALADAVGTRMSAEVPFGVFLSGGVDSGLVATLAARAWRRPFPTFTLRIPHEGYDESGYARRVADRIGSEHHEIVLDARVAEESIHAWASRMDQPLGDPSVIPTWVLARHASAHVPVVLTGEGADELFAGYPTYLGHRHAALARALPGFVAEPVLALARRFRPRHHHATIGHLLEAYLSARTLSPYERHLAWFGTARAGEALALLGPELRERVRADEPMRYARDLEHALTAVRSKAGPLAPSGRATPLTAYQLLDFETYLSGDLLTKVDRCTMAHGVESRAPFLRRSIIELALALPDHAKLRGTSGKWALKQMAEHLLPPDVLHRRKQGFSPPFAAWARGPLRALVADTLSPARVARAGVLDPQAVNGLLARHLDGSADRGRTLWAVLSLQFWAEHWLESSPRTESRPAQAGAARTSVPDSERVPTRS